MAYLYLTIAILAEVVGTMALKASAGMTKLGPTAIVVLGYAVAFFFLSLTLKHIAVGVAYAIWSGVGVVLIAVFGVILFRERLDAAAVIGIALILAGVLVLKLFSRTA